MINKEMQSRLAANADLNMIQTGGRFGAKRRYPGFVISRNKNGRFSIFRETGEPIAGAGTIRGVSRIMTQYRNPYTGEPFSDYEESGS